jgi:predicted DNA-binding protein with PD1-like motif
MSGILRGETLIVDIPPGCDLLEQLKQYLDKRHSRLAAVLSGIGMLKNVQLTYTKQSMHKLEGSVELLSASGTVRRENNRTIINIGVIVSKDGKLFAGKLSSGCFTAMPDGVTLFLSIIGEKGKL